MVASAYRTCIVYVVFTRPSQRSEGIDKITVEGDKVDDKQILSHPNLISVTLPLSYVALLWMQ